MRRLGLGLLCVILTAARLWGTVSIDSQVFADSSAAVSSVPSPAISTSGGNELLLALIATDALSSKMTVNSVTGGGLTWALVERTNTQSGTSEIWRALAVSHLSNAVSRQPWHKRFGEYFNC